MNIVLWIVQILLALMFLFHGRIMWVPPKLPQSGMAYLLAIPTGLRRLIGVAEILAGLGVVLPILTGILSWLTPWAASGLVILMTGAAIFHIRRKEYRNIGLNLILLVLAAFVAYGRFFVFPL